MSFVTFWLPIIGSLLLGGVAVGNWYGGHKIMAIWVGFAGCVCFLLLVALQIQSAVQRRGAVHTDPNRAWVSIDVIGHSGILWEQLGGRIEVMFTLKNTGKTPATNVFFEAKSILPKIGEPSIPLQAMKDYANDIRRRRAMSEAAGEVIFPEGVYQTNMGMVIDRKSSVELLSMSKMDELTPRIIACASYSVDGSIGFRKTCTSYYIITPNPGGPSGTFRGVAVDRNYPAQQIGISSAFYSIAD